MNIKYGVRRLIEHLANIHIFRVLPRGIDVAYDIANAFPAYRMETVFDVGANVGQSAKRYVSCFPSSRIYCFEPVRDTFRQLQDNLMGNDRVHCIQLALGSVKRHGRMAVQGRSDRFFLLGQSKHSPANEEGLTTEPVDVVTLDEFCCARKIGHISYLKVDTEGADLEVLKGGAGVLTEQRIDFVEVEAGMNAGNVWHVPFESLKGYLESRSYLVFGLYGQRHEWPTNEPHLRRTNVTFISRRMVEMNKAFRVPPPSRRSAWTSLRTVLHRREGLATSQ
jgi:FkbM family methyltransferase